MQFWAPTTLWTSCHRCCSNRMTNGISNRPPLEPWRALSADPDFQLAMPCGCLRSTVCGLVRRTTAPTALGNLRPTAGIENVGVGFVGVVDNAVGDYCCRYCFPPSCGGDPKKMTSCFALVVYVDLFFMNLWTDWATS